MSCFGGSPELLQEGVELFGVINFLEAADVGGPVLNLCKNGGPSVLPLQAPSGAGSVQFMCMLMRLDRPNTAFQAAVDRACFCA